MKFLFINISSGVRSTGRICTDIAAALEKDGHTVRIGYGRFSVPERFGAESVRIGGTRDILFHVFRARCFDGMGLGSRRATERFVRWVKEYDPDVIHLHNIHGYYINYEVLFDYLRNCGKTVIWTLHDCWSFTGHCAYFDYAGCGKWQNGCSECPEKGVYPKRALFDRSRRNYLLKKRLFTGIPNLTLVTPSEWLAGLAGRSFMSEYPIKVIRSGVDVSVFRPTDSDIRARLGVEGKKVILGVAAVWDRRKGLDYFIKLAGRLDDSCRIVLVGLERKRHPELPESIIAVGRTSSQTELAEFYTAADVFVNTTLEDNYPTTNIEAIACGTPVISFDTGGSGESARIFGTVVKKGDVDGLVEAIESVGSVQRADGSVDIDQTVAEYRDLYYGTVK